MPLDDLKAGKPIVGILVDGEEKTPFVGAALRIVPNVGVELKIPYLEHEPTGQFAHVSQWFRRMEPAANLQFVAGGAVVSLFGLRWAGHASHGLGTDYGTLRPMETVLAERDGPLSEPLAIETVRSRIDGLNDWSKLTAITSDIAPGADGRAQRLTVVAETRGKITWRQGEAELELQAHWKTDRPEDGYGRALSIADNVILQSSFPSPRPFVDHFIEQRKVANLVVLMYGRAASFRQHSVHDDTFTEKLLSGEIFDRPFVELISARTFRESSRPIPSSRDFSWPCATLPEVGTDGLEAWASNYDEWKRFILPSVNAFSRHDAVVEDIVLSTSMALEAAGHKLGYREGEEATFHNGRPTSATWAYRCLHILALPLGDIAESTVGLARAMARNYNRVKHPERGEFPEYSETLLISLVNRWVVRLVALTLTGSSSRLLASHREAQSMWHLNQRFEDHQLLVTDDGTWKRRVR